MNNQDFEKLVESVNQMGAIMRGDSIPHRRTTLGKVDVRGLRDKLKLTQSEFANMIGVSIRTLQNWEQDNLVRLSRSRLAEQCALLNPADEQEMADEFSPEELDQWQQA